MRLIPWSDVGRGPLIGEPVAATIGVFDGVHRGHQSLLVEVTGATDSPGGSVVVTFRDNPKKLLNPAYAGDLMTWDEKVEALAGLGVQTVVVIDFSAPFSRMSGRDFFAQLKRSFVFSKLVLGWNFSFGKGSATGAADLGWLADPTTRLTILPAYTWRGDVVSSSGVRQAIVEGRLDRARDLLGRPYRLPLVPPFPGVDGRCTVARAAVGKLLPPAGVYPARWGGRTVSLQITNETLSWESPPGNHQELVFD